MDASVSASVSAPASLTPSPLAEMEQAEQTTALWQAVQRLPRLWALVIILFYREEKSTAEIAEIIQAPQNTVKTYLSRGRQCLKEILNNDQKFA